MAVTTVIKSVGTTSRDYSTLQACEDASPTNLTTTRASITVTGSTSSTIVLDALASAVNSFYVGHAVYCDARPTEKRLITAYDGTTKVATIGVLNGSSATWANTPSTEAFTIDGTIWKVECYNDSEFIATGGSSVLLTIAGQTVDSTQFIWLTAAAGQSFQDHASVRTNPQKYDQSKGVGLRNSGAYGRVMSVTTARTRIDRLQGKCSATNGSRVVEGDSTACFHKDNIWEQAGNTHAIGIFYDTTVYNCVMVLTNTGGNGVRSNSGTSGPTLLFGCTIIRTSNRSASGSGVSGDYAGACKLKSTAIFNFSSVGTNLNSDSERNATNLSSGLPGSNNQHSVTFSQTTPFTDASAAALDLRAIAATSLASNGLLDATNAPNDISGLARSATPTIGHWELAAAAGRLPGPVLIRQAVHRASYF